MNAIVSASLLCSERGSEEVRDLNFFVFGECLLNVSMNHLDLTCETEEGKFSFRFFIWR